MDQLTELFFQTPSWAFFALGAVVVVWVLKRRFARRSSGVSAKQVKNRGRGQTSAAEEIAIIARVAAEIDPSAKGLGASGYGLLELPRHSVQGGDFIKSIGGHSETAMLAARLGRDEAAVAKPSPTAKTGGILAFFAAVVSLVKRIFAIVRIATVATVLAVAAYPFLSDDHKEMLQPYVDSLFPPEMSGQYAELFQTLSRNSGVSDAAVVIAPTSALSSVESPDRLVMATFKTEQPETGEIAPQNLQQDAALESAAEGQLQVQAAPKAVIATRDAPLPAARTGEEDRVSEGRSEDLKAEVAEVVARPQDNRAKASVAMVKDWHPGTGKPTTTVRHDAAPVRTVVIQGGAGNDVIIAGNFSIPELPAGAKGLIALFLGSYGAAIGYGVLQVLAAGLGLMMLLWVGKAAMRRRSSGLSRMKDPFERLLERRQAEMA